MSYMSKVYFMFLCTTPVLQLIIIHTLIKCVMLHLLLPNHMFTSSFGRSHNQSEGINTFVVQKFLVNYLNKCVVYICPYQDECSQQHHKYLCSMEKYSIITNACC